MAIEDNIRAVQAEVQQDQTGKKGDNLRNLAIAAIYSGIGSPEWNTYMDNFANTPTELARLRTRDGDGCHPYIPLARAYLVANAVCLPGTTGRLLDGIEGIIDKTLQ
jgi:hypothetical protein